jgi:hypothetical protein
MMAFAERFAIGLAGVCLSAFMFFVMQPARWTFPMSRLSGSALAGGLGLLNACESVGGFVVPR